MECPRCGSDMDRSTTCPVCFTPLGATPPGSPIPTATPAPVAVVTPAAPLSVPVAGQGPIPVPERAPVAPPQPASLSASALAQLAAPSVKPPQPHQQTLGADDVTQQVPTTSAVPTVTSQVRVGLDGQTYVVEPSTPSRWGGAAPPPPASPMGVPGAPGVTAPPPLPTQRHAASKTGAHAPLGKRASNAPITIALMGMLVCTLAVIGGMWWWKYVRPGPYPLTSKLRYYMVGDEWDYNVSLSASIQGMSVGDLRAKMKIKIVNATVDNQPVLARQLRFEFKGRLKLSLDATEYIRQDSKTGDVYKLGETRGPGEVPRLDDEPTLDTPGTYSKDMVLTVPDAEEAGLMSASRRLAGTEVVSTPAGQFHTWKVEGSGSGTSGSISADGTATEWVCPQLGMPVKIVVNGSDAMGGKFDMTITLESTNVKLQPGKPGS